jgi:hypothetical protein
VCFYNKPKKSKKEKINEKVFKVKAESGRRKKIKEKS